MKRVAVLVSGGGTNLQALLESERRGENPNGKIELVVASKPGVYALERAANFGVESAVVSRRDYADSAAFDAALLDTLQKHSIDVVVLAGFLSVLGEKVIAAYRNKIINVHPSLIPSFCGPGFYGLRVHEAALARGVKLTGATVHLVNEECDGGPILLQKAVAVEPDDTPETLQKRVMVEAEWQLLPTACGRSPLAEGAKASRLPLRGSCPRSGLRERALPPHPVLCFCIHQNEVIMKKNIYKYLAGNDYPGRGIVLGKSPDGQKAFVAYWIMGRSANSRNRVFEPIDGGIRTVAADPAKLEDPHLIIYNAVLTLRETTVVTNGDQTDTIARFMNGNLFPGYSFEAALATRTYEDDAPNFTPRISGVVDMRRGGYKLSIVKSDEGNAESVQRQTFDYPQPVAGEGHFISTYVKNGAPIPSFAGEPLRVAIDTNDADKFADKLWASLNEDNKVSLFVRSIELETGEYEDIILNKYTAVEG